MQSNSLISKNPKQAMRDDIKRLRYEKIIISRLFQYILADDAKEFGQLLTQHSWVDINELHDLSSVDIHFVDTFLDFAIGYKKRNIIRYLLTLNVEIEDTTLSWAIVAHDYEIIKLILDNSEASSIKTVMFMSLTEANIKDLATTRNIFELLLNKLLELPLDDQKQILNAVDEGDTILYCIIYNSTVELLKTFLESKVAHAIDVNVQGDSVTPLELAVHLDNDDMVKELLAFPKININYNNIIHRAVEEKAFNSLNIILKHSEEISNTTSELTFHKIKKLLQAKEHIDLATITETFDILFEKLKKNNNFTELLYQALLLSIDNNLTKMTQILLTKASYDMLSIDKWKQLKSNVHKNNMQFFAVEIDFFITELKKDKNKPIKNAQITLTKEKNTQQEREEKKNEKQRRKILIDEFLAKKEFFEKEQRKFDELYEKYRTQFSKNVLDHISTEYDGLITKYYAIAGIKIKKTENNLLEQSISKIKYFSQQINQLYINLNKAGQQNKISGSEIKKSSSSMQKDVTDQVEPAKEKKNDKVAPPKPVTLHKSTSQQNAKIGSILQRFDTKLGVTEVIVPPITKELRFGSTNRLSQSLAQHNLTQASVLATDWTPRPASLSMQPLKGSPKKWGSTPSAFTTVNAPGRSNPTPAVTRSSPSSAAQSLQQVKVIAPSASGKSHPTPAVTRSSPSSAAQSLQQVKVITPNVSGKSHPTPAVTRSSPSSAAQSLQQVKVISPSASGKSHSTPAVIRSSPSSAAQSLPPAKVIAPSASGKSHSAPAVIRSSPSSAAQSLQQVKVITPSGSGKSHSAPAVTRSSPSSAAQSLQQVKVITPSASGKSHSTPAVTRSIPSSAAQSPQPAKVIAPNPSGKSHSTPAVPSLHPREDSPQKSDSNTALNFSSKNNDADHSIPAPVLSGNELTPIVTQGKEIKTQIVAIHHAFFKHPVDLYMNISPDQMDSHITSPTPGSYIPNNLHSDHGAQLVKYRFLIENPFAASPFNIEIGFGTWNLANICYSTVTEKGLYTNNPWGVNETPFTYFDRNMRQIHMILSMIQRKKMSLFFLQEINFLIENEELRKYFLKEIMLLGFFCHIASGPNQQPLALIFKNTIFEYVHSVGVFPYGVRDRGHLYLLKHIDTNIIFAVVNCHMAFKLQKEAYAETILNLGQSMTERGYVFILGGDHNHSVLELKETARFKISESLHPEQCIFPDNIMTCLQRNAEKDEKQEAKSCFDFFVIQGNKQTLEITRIGEHINFFKYSPEAQTFVRKFNSSLLKHKKNKTKKVTPSQGMPEDSFRRRFR